MKTIVISLLLSFFLLNFPVFASPGSRHYALIIDAGSTGSRLHLFEYSLGTKIPLIHDLFSESVKPGLSSYENTPETAGASLKKPLDDALAELKKRQVGPATVSISLFGTAGLRLLDADKQAALYHNVALYLENNYPFSLGEIKTIPGTLEGLFGWLDVNYLLNNFDSPIDITKGSIDMGGASTEITFSTLDTSKAEEEFKLRLGGLDYLIYSKSFLGLGLIEALKQVNQQPLAATCYPAQYPLSEANQGRFNFASCSDLYATVIHQAEVRQQLPSLAFKDFVAHSGVYFTESFFAADQTPSQAVLLKQVQAVCGQTWEQLQAAHPQEAEKYLATYCANGVYLNQLLYEAYQLHEKQLVVTNQLNQQEVDWTLGALLYQLVQP